MVLSNEEFYSKLNVIYIESNQTTAKYFENILKKTFNKVYLFDSSKNVFEYFLENKNNIDLIISDMQLEKGVLGIDLLNKVRDIDEELPFIITTGVLDSKELLEALKLNVTDFLIKPLGAKSLLDSVEKICRTKYYEQTKAQTMKNLEDIFEVVNEVAIVSKTNKNNEITFVNKSFLEVSHYLETEVINKKIDLIVNDKNTLQEILNTISQGNTWEGKVKNLSKNKEEFYTYLTVIPIKDETTNNIYEFTWIGFLATQYELEQKKFRKKVIENINKNRRINIEAREKIDELFAQLSKYKNIDNSIALEVSRQDKFKQQLRYFNDETNERKKKLSNLSVRAKEKLTIAAEKQDEVKIKSEQMEILLDSVNSEFDLKNKTIRELKKEIDKHQKIIDRLLLKIEHKEGQLGLE